MDVFQVVKDKAWSDMGVKHLVEHPSMAAYRMMDHHALAVELLPVGNPVDPIHPLTVVSAREY